MPNSQVIQKMKLVFLPFQLFVPTISRPNDLYQVFDAMLSSSAGSKLGYSMGVRTLIIIQSYSYLSEECQYGFVCSVVTRQENVSVASVLQTVFKNPL